MNMNMNQCAIAALVGGVGSYYISNKLTKTKISDVTNRLKAAHDVILKYTLGVEVVPQVELDAAMSGFASAIGSLEKLSI